MTPQTPQNETNQIIGWTSDPCKCVVAGCGTYHHVASYMIRFEQNYMKFCSKWSQIDFTLWKQFCQKNMNAISSWPHLQVFNDNFNFFGQHGISGSHMCRFPWVTIRSIPIWRVPLSRDGSILAGIKRPPQNCMFFCLRSYKNRLGDGLKLGSSGLLSCCIPRNPG